MDWVLKLGRKRRKTQKNCKIRGDARIELATSCTLSKNHTTRPITLVSKNAVVGTRKAGGLPHQKMRSPGIEPGSITWQATIITTRPRTRIRTHQGLARDENGCTRAPLTQSVEYWSYEPKVAGSSPAWSSRPFAQRQHSTKRKALKPHAQKVDSNHWDVNPPWI